MVIDAPAAGPPTGPFAVQRPPAAAPPRRRHPVARAFGAVVGWLSAGLATLGLVAHFLDTTHQSLIVLASGAWVLAPFSILALGLHLWRRGWLAVIVVVLLVAGQTAVYAPLFVADAAPSSPAATIKVLTQNLLYGQAKASRLVQRVKAEQIDVLAVQELTQDSADALRAGGLDKLLPYSVLDPRPKSPGTGIWSRYPIADQQRLAASRGMAGVVATITLPGDAKLTALSLHPSAPFPQDPADWYSDLDQIRDLLLSLPPGQVIAAGDFNSTLDHARFRRLLVDGWHDGAEQAGAGVIRSWPSNLAVPALVGIDHVLTRGLVVTSATTVVTPGSDHLGLLTTVAVPR